jgi:hypothetical protein
VPFLTPLDRTLHDVEAFTCGVPACDEDLRQQARKPRNRCLVMAHERRILAFGRYSHAEMGTDRALMPCVRIDFIARDRAADPGLGTEFLLRLLIRIAGDPKADLARGVMIDSMNCGDPAVCDRRWRFFTEKFGFTPLREDGLTFGYAFMPMSRVSEIAAEATSASGSQDN